MFVMIPSPAFTIRQSHSSIYEVWSSCVWVNIHTDVNVCISTVAQCTHFKWKGMTLEEKAITELTCVWHIRQHTSFCFFRASTRCVRVDVIMVDWGQSRHVFNGLSWVHHFFLIILLNLLLSESIPLGMKQHYIKSTCDNINASQEKLKTAKL